jgi:hypothetical protein
MKYLAVLYLTMRCLIVNVLLTGSRTQVAEKSYGKSDTSSRGSLTGSLTQVAEVVLREVGHK